MGVDDDVLGDVYDDACDASGGKAKVLAFGYVACYDVCEYEVGETGEGTLADS